MNADKVVSDALQKENTGCANTISACGGSLTFEQWEDVNSGRTCIQLHALCSFQFKHCCSNFHPRM